MIVLLFLLVMEAALAIYIATRVMRNRVLPSPTLRAAILTASSLLAGMISVTAPFENLLDGPDGATIWLPTLLKHLGLLGCGVGVLLMGLAQRQINRAGAEASVWLWFTTSTIAVAVLHVVAGGNGLRTSVAYVEWSHSQPLLLVAMLIAYIGGLVASLGFFTVIWPLRLGSSTGRGLAIMVTGALFASGWCLARLDYLRRSVLLDSPPADGEFLVTQLLSLASIALLTAGLVWSTAEADLAALHNWSRFRGLSRRVLEVVPEVRRESDRRLGFDTWVSDRAVEVLDGLHQIALVGGARTGFPVPPDTVGDAEVSAVVAGLGRDYGLRVVA